MRIFPMRNGFFVIYYMFSFNHPKVDHANPHILNQLAIRFEDGFPV
jgi:hypothetical protein